ncbi:HEPN domain-containing protein [Methanobrevibacter smithii]|uniref:HEPN domain-containing protein n=2 Tax=Methanobrevibacter TaxID=2172 RepID=UPI000369EDDA|nr:HEPN domain-containing protein [Methanobrevibacter smithii]
MFPLIPNLVQFTSGQLSLTNLLNIENLVYNIEKTDELNIDCIINDKKLILALEIYSKLSQYHFKAQFLDLITILEILKPKYQISNNSMKHLDMIKKHIKKLRDDASEKNSEEYDELNRYLSSMNFWDEKSINKSLKIYVNENKVNFGDYENIETKLKDVYDIRSKLIHNGKISDEKEFYEKYQFLKDFVKELLLDRINGYKN